MTADGPEHRAGKHHHRRHQTSGNAGNNCCYGAAIDNVAVTAGVPEPATWALMLVGFGGLGAALRSRRSRPVAA